MVNYLLGLPDVFLAWTGLQWPTNMLFSLECIHAVWKCFHALNTGHAIRLAGLAGWGGHGFRSLRHRPGSLHVAKCAVMFSRSNISSSGEQVSAFTGMLRWR